MRTQQPLTRVAGGAPAKPQQIPAKGWLDILLRVKEQLTTDNASQIFPALTAIVLLYGLFASP